MGTPLEGLWTLERGDGCLAAMEFAADGRYGYGVGCRLETGQLGLEKHAGQWMAGGGELELHKTHSTCAGEPEIDRMRYRVEGDRLLLDLADGRLVFERSDSDGSGSGVIRFGCWDGDTLVFRGLQPL